MDFARNNAYPTPLQNNPFLPILLLSLARQRNAPRTTSTFKEEYDYVIVGAGSGGSVVASRLSEVPCVSVLLLEAGNPAPLLDDVPVLARNFWFTDLDWAYKTVPQKHAGFGLVNKQVIFPAGRGLGGSSLLNGMMYVRGNRMNFDNWARNGSVGWSASDVWPYFLKMENNSNPEYLANGYHVANGPVSIEKPKYDPEIKKPLLETAALLGYSIVDVNGPSQTGYVDHQAFYRDGQRCSTAKAYLVPAENRTNLDIVSNAFVKKVLFKGKRATAVQFDFKGSEHTVKAKREVIMSAGATNTPQLLMLSGIGPKTHLQKLKIKVVADLPVGDNLQDHCAVPVPFQTDKKIPSILQKGTNPISFLEYVNSRSGVFTSTESVSLLAFLNGRNHPKDLDFPDFQLFLGEFPLEYAKNQFGLTPEIYEKSFGPYENSSAYVCLAQILQPKSRGTVRLNSTNPYDPPLIDPNYLADPSDVEVLVDAIKTCHIIGTSQPMQKVKSRHLSNPVPGCENGTTDERYACIAKTVLITISHQSGTSKMGDPDDPTTVVDPELRVKGVKGLRVVDASIMPTLTSGNTNAPTIMIGEKASDMIKSTIRCPS